MDESLADVLRRMQADRSIVNVAVESDRMLKDVYDRMANPTPPVPTPKPAPARDEGFYWVTVTWANNRIQGPEVAYFADGYWTWCGSDDEAKEDNPNISIEVRSKRLVEEPGS